MTNRKRHYVGLSLAILTAASMTLSASPAEKGGTETLGQYFEKKQYTPAPLPAFSALREQLPSPIYDANPLWVQVYWKAWELASKNFYEPPPASGFVSSFIDAAFNQNVFLWDSCFMTMFCNYGYPLVPGISTLDNLYAKQHADGEICREIVRKTGVDFGPWTNPKGKPLFSRWGWPSYQQQEAVARNAPVHYVGRSRPPQPPKLTLDGLDHPIFAWAELESYRVTGNRGRLEMVWEPLIHFYRALQEYLRQGNGLYMTDWASMDNSPRNHYLNGGGTGIDISSEMVLFARQLAEIAAILGKQETGEQYIHEADALSEIINRQMWDPNQRFYFDLTVKGERAPVKTVAAYWTLIAKVASPEQAAALLSELDNHATFGRMNAVPTLAADGPGYDPAGGYWRGSVWVPTETMVVRGLESYGYRDRARQLALSHLNLVAQVFQNTGTIWENYAPDSIAPGKPAKKDFVGWSGVAPIVYLLEYGIGLKPDSTHNLLIWDLQSDARTGCERYRFNGHVASLVAEPAPGENQKFAISVESDGPFTLQVSYRGKQRSFAVEKGRQKFDLD